MKKIKTIALPVFFCLILFVIALFPTTVCSEPTILYVDGKGIDNYDSIQEAINNAKSGDIIEISPGLYKGNIVIDKSLIIKGVNKDTTIITGEGSGNIVEIIANNVILQNLTIKNSTYDSPDVDQTMTGVSIKSDSSTITDCIVMNCNVGMILKNSTDHMIKNSIVTNNNGGIDLFNVTNSKVMYSEISNNKLLWGLSIRKNQQIIVSTCNISSNNVGIGISQSSDNTINHNIIKGNSGIGVYIVRDAEGICCKNNIIIENNFIDNQGLNTRDDCDDNLWDNEILGNYWDDYNGTDSDSDGIGDTPWKIFGGLVDNFDRYPLMSPMDINVDLNSSENIILTISYPLANTTLDGTITILGTVSNKEVESVKIKIDEGEWKQADGTSSWNYELDTTQYENGKHTIYVQATDSQGIISTKNIDINIENSISKTKDEHGTPGFEIIFIFFAMFIVLIFLHYKNLKKGGN